RDRPYGDRAVQVRVRSLSPVAERKRRGPAATPGLVLLLLRAGCEWCRALRARREQLLRMRERRLALRVAAEQAGKLRNARLAGELLDDRRRARVPLLLPYEQVMLRTGRDLRPVGDDKDLAVARHVAQRIADGVCDLPADTGIHLVEHEGRHVVPPGKNRFECEHDTGQLAARRDARERARLESPVQRNPELDVFRAVR